MRIEPRSLGIRLFGNEVVPISVCEVPQQLYKVRVLLSVGVGRPQLIVELL